MAIGIDDAVTLGVAAVKIGQTLVEVVERYKDRGGDIDLALLLEQIKITARKRIEDAELALFQFERMLLERGVNLERNLNDVIKETSPLRWFEQHRLSEIRKQFNQFCDSISSAIDDVSALARCHQRTNEIGEAAVASLRAKDDFQMKLLHAPSLKSAIELLRMQLGAQKLALSV